LIPQSICLTPLTVARYLDLPCGIPTCEPLRALGSHLLFSLEYRSIRQ